MKLTDLLILCVVGVVDILAIALLLPWLINSAGTLGMIATPFVIVIAGWATVKQVSAIFNKKG